MNAYLPTEPRIASLFVGLAIAVVAGGYWLNRFGDRRRARILAWFLVVGTLLAVERITQAQPAGVRMVMIIVGLLYAMKSVVAVESRRSGQRPLSFARWLAFCVLWFGMRPAAFLAVFAPARRRAGALMVSGAFRIIFGATLIAAAGMIARRTASTELTDRPLLVALCLLMTGVSLSVHFGLFDLLAGIWRRFGADCQKLFRAPFLSRSLTEFWSRRWNRAFSDMTALAVFRPVRQQHGVGFAKTLAFLFSGLMHELAISVPVHAGYGMPFAYFVLHALAMRLESARLVRRAMQSRVFAQTWTAGWILLPLPLLFHRPFCEGVLLPLLRAWQTTC